MKPRSQLTNLERVRYQFDYDGWLSYGLSPLAAHELAMLALYVRRSGT